MLSELRSILKEAGQEQILTFASELTPEQLEQLANEIRSVNFDEVNSLFKEVTTRTPQSRGAVGPPTRLDWQSNVNLEGPVSITRLADVPESVVDSWEESGFRMIAQRKLGAVVMAGGQGTRLGYDGPKGCFQVGPLSKRSLFELFSQRLIRLRHMAVEKNLAPNLGAVQIPFAVMTSTHNHDETVRFFEENSYFGLDSQYVRFFKQMMIPAYDMQGKVLLDQKHGMCLSPNGNGGIFKSMARTGTLQWLKDHGVESVHVFGTDNVLTKVADPVFNGFCHSMGVEVGNKCTEKTDPNEKVGVMVSKVIDGTEKACVVDYAEVSSEMAQRVCREGGPLEFSAGNICNHYFTVAFIEKLLKADVMERDHNLHRADKKITHVDLTTGERVTPDVINGLKVELFIFDCFQLAAHVVGLEVPREAEFAPVKNASGADSPQTAAELLCGLHAKWLADAGAHVNVSAGPVEIAPRVSYNGENLQKYSGEVVKGPLRIDA
ncbi:MAG: hypothetical protein KVP17_002825 [Porospora cf. gigantea B]|uniref:uncharacterized protein n=1 Tax=Porospora cf. gigantea B TaxID=2853592 RepID=UPI003571E171|nr:MAG: hypothetical protein KVP17_002825 [Porospora cf. gigantea B]